MERMDRLGLSAAAQLLALWAWTYAALRRTDGRITAREARRLAHGTVRNQRALVDAAVWTPDGMGAYLLADYLLVNLTRAEIEARQAESRRRTAEWRGRQVAANPGQQESSDGLRDASRDDALPDHSPSPHQGDQGNPPPPDDAATVVDDTASIMRQSYVHNVHDVRDVRTGGPSRGKVTGRTASFTSGKGRDSGAASRTQTLAPWEDPRWEGVRDAWEGRGLMEPPSPGQRRLLWAVAVEFPDLVGDWIEEAPDDGPSTFGIVQYVLAAAAEEQERRANLAVTERFYDLTEQERAAWFKIEHPWIWLDNPARDARTRGTRLPAVGPDENPYRVMLAQLPAIREARRLPLTGKMASDATGAAPNLGDAVADHDDAGHGDVDPVEPDDAEGGFDAL
jgi:hypothetical protein